MATYHPWMYLYLLFDYNAIRLHVHEHIILGYLHLDYMGAIWLHIITWCTHICFWTIWLHNWATSWENLFLPYANNRDADQPAHPRSLISAFVVRCLGSIKSLVYVCAMLRLYLVSEAEQVGLSLNWSQIPKTGFLVTWLISSLGIMN